MCGLYIEELLRTSTMIEQWSLYTKWRRTQMHSWTIRLSLIPLCVVTMCVEMNLSVNISASKFKLPFRKFGNVICWYYFHTNISFLSTRVSELHQNYVTFTKWGGVEYETTSVHGPQCNFRPGNTTSAQGIQLPSTVDNFRQHLLHHNNSFIAFSTNELKLRGLRRGWVPLLFRSVSYFS